MGSQMDKWGLESEIVLPASFTATRIKLLHLTEGPSRQRWRTAGRGDEDSERMDIWADVDRVIITSPVVAVYIHLVIKCSYAKWITWLSSHPGESGAVATINLLKPPNHRELGWTRISRAVLPLEGPDRREEDVRDRVRSCLFRLLLV